MLGDSLRLRAYVLAVACIVFCADSRAQTALLNEVHTIAAADRAVPIEHSFDISVAGTYTITLTDLGAGLTPAAPVAAVKLAVTNGNTVVGMPLTAAGSMQLAATVGTYVVHVVGAPGTVAGSGAIGVRVTNAAAEEIASFSDILALPSTAVPGNEAVLDESFTVPAAGSYQVALTDLNLPHSLGVLTLLLTQAGASSPVVILPDATNNNALQANVNLQPGVTYRLFAIGQEVSGAGGGLFSAVVSPPAGAAPVLSITAPLGAVTLLGTPSLSAGNYTLAASDLGLPAPLSQLAVVATVHGQIAAQLAATGSQGFAATTNAYQVFALATPAASPGTGSYSVNLQGPSGPPALNVARAVSTPGTAVTAYSFDATVASAGPYALELADFTFPSNFASITAAAVQNGALLGTALNAAGSQNITAAAGPLSLLVFAQPGASGSLFGIDLAAGGGGGRVFETTQGVGQLFAARKVSITTPGNYGVTVADAGFPAPLSTFAVIVTQGTSHLGSIFGGGTVSFAATAGNYFINFIAQPGGTDGAGTYAMSAAASPVVTFQASANSVASGGTVNLTWSSQNADSCTASGGWSGSQPVSGGTATSVALTSATTFTLSCSGLGGTVAKSVAVTIDAPPAPGGGGGGGALDLAFLLLLAAVTLIRLWLVRCQVRPAW